MPIKGNLLEIKKGIYVKGKWGVVKIKGALIRGGKGKGHLSKLSTFPMKKGHL